MRKYELCLVMVILLGLSLLVAGCEEEKWGQGDPPLEYQQRFGNSNLARLDFLQTQRINEQYEILVKMAERIAELEKCHSSRENHKKRLAGI